MRHANIVEGWVISRRTSLCSRYGDEDDFNFAREFESDIEARNLDEEHLPRAASTGVITALGFGVIFAGLRTPWGGFLSQY